MPDETGRIDIKALTPEELAERFAAMDLPSYRAGQVFSWLSGGARSFEEMTDLPRGLRARLDGACELPCLTEEKRQVSADGTEKFLWRLPDGESVETVLMRYKHGNTVCVSTQVGCKMGCAFCASTLGGKVRDLRVSEMLDEVIRTGQAAGAPVTGVVLMGIGEPLDNFDNVVRFLRLINHPQGQNIGMRHISLSTCGLVEGIDKLAALHLQLTLSVSLHAPDDETRDRLMPVNRRYGVKALLEACERYFRTTGRRVSYEYALVRGVNDTPRHARLLAGRLRGAGAHVNLIRLNPVPERGLAPSAEERVRAFAKELSDGGVTVTIRRRLGIDIDAACGQLRRGEMRRP